MCNSVPAHDIVMVIGDMNAKFGSDIAGETPSNPSIGVHGMRICNNNATRLVNFSDGAGLVVGGTIFPHRNVHKGTWRSPNMSHVNQIHRIIISRRYTLFLNDVRTHRGADI